MHKRAKSALFGTATKGDTFTKRDPFYTPNGVITSTLYYFFLLCTVVLIHCTFCLSEK